MGKAVVSARWGKRERKGKTAETESNLSAVDAHAVCASGFLAKAIFATQTMRCTSRRPLATWPRATRAAFAAATVCGHKCGPKIQRQATSTVK